MDWSPSASYQIFLTPGKNGEIQIQRKGRTAYIAERKSHIIHSPELRLVTPAIDGGATVASARLKASHRGTRVLLGDPDQTSKREWQNVAAVDSLYTKYGFEFEGRRYIWRKVVPQDLTARDIAVKLRFSDMELVDEVEPDNVLAIYEKQRGSIGSAGGDLIGKFDALQDLGEDLEVLALVSVLGLKECVYLDDRARNSPLAKGPVPVMAFGIGGGIVGGGGGC